MMKTLLRLWPVLLLALGSLRAADDGLIAAVRAADDARVAAMLAGDEARLNATLSDELRYAHSSGHLNDKASYIKARLAADTAYHRVEYQERTFQPAAPGVVLMFGRVLIHSGRAEKPPVDLNFLAVWREERGAWRLLAWQSNTHTEPAAPAAK